MTKRLVVLPLMLSLAAAAAVAQRVSHLSVNVRNDDGSPVGEATVTIKRWAPEGTDKTFVLEGHTDPAGRFKTELALPADSLPGFDITISLHPRYEAASASWRIRNGPTSWNSLKVDEFKDGDIVVLRKESSKDRSLQGGFTRDVLPLPCILTASDGKPADPNHVRWEFFAHSPPQPSSSSGTGGFAMDREHPLFLYPTRDDPAVFYSPYLVPGEYSLSITYKRKRLPLREKPIVVRAGEETLLNIEPPSLLAEDQPAPEDAVIPIRVTVRRDGKPAPGVIVRSTIGLDQKSVSGISIQGDGTHKELYSEYEQRGHLLNYEGDVTDDEGNARFLARSGSLFVAAIDHKQRVAWKDLIITRDQTGFTLDLKPLAEAMPEIPRPRNPVKAPNPLYRAAAMLGLN